MAYQKCVYRLFLVYVCLYAWVSANLCACLCMCVCWFIWLTICMLICISSISWVWVLLLLSISTSAYLYGNSVCQHDSFLHIYMLEKLHTGMSNLVCLYLWLLANITHHSIILSYKPLALWVIGQLNYNKLFWRKWRNQSKNWFNRTSR